jgi:hypothetical protein
MKKMLKTQAILLRHCIVALMLLPLPLLAQVPLGINYQAVVRDGGSLLQNQVLAVKFTLLADGQTAYEETQILTSDDRGLIEAVIGSGTVLNGSLDSLAWGEQSIDLSVSLDIGAGFVSLGTAAIQSVPYSRFAQQVADISTHTLSDLADVDTSAISTGEVLSWDGSQWTGQAFDQPWTRSGNQISFNGNAVGIRTTNPTSTLTVRGNLDMLEYPSNDRKIRMYGNSWGALDISGSAGSRNVLISNTAGNTDYGFVGVYNNTNDERAYMEIVSNIGRIVARGPNNQRNAVMTWLNGNTNNGYMGVYDSNSLEAGMYVNSSGQGIVFGDTKNFRMEHPTEPGKEIWYASLEGPEAGAYERGTATLVNGRATVTLSDHFQLVAASEGMTVVLTPLSGSSKGLAVIQKSAQGFAVVELMDGQGNYDFDWEIKAVRKGYEDYRVIRDASESRPGLSPEEERAHDLQPAGEPVSGN